MEEEDYVASHYRSFGCHLRLCYGDYQAVAAVQFMWRVDDHRHGDIPPLRQLRTISL
jgi:hypothetical protein